MNMSMAFRTMKPMNSTMTTRTGRAISRITMASVVSISRMVGMVGLVGCDRSCHNLRIYGDIYAQHVMAMDCHHGET
jgi:hypothetical protein